jgi:dienelactone hydrolase
MWSPDDFLGKLYSATLAASYDRLGDSVDISAKQQEMKRRLQHSLGAIPTVKAPLEPELLDQFEHDGLMIEQLAYTTYEGMRVPAYALYPKDWSGEKLPGVLACHGHGHGQRAALGMKPDGTFDEEPGIHNQFAVELARRGMFVHVPEIIGFGDRRLKASVEKDPAAKESSCAPISNLLLLSGMTIAGVRVYEARCGLDYLQSRPEVDGGRIGALGFSGGGLVASLTAGLDTRIQAAVLCGYTNTFKGSILDRPHCIDNYIPGILQLAEQPELIGLIAPRPLFIESGLEDKVFPIEAVEEAIHRLIPIYESLGARDQLTVDLFPGKHEISGRSSFDWLKAQLT